MLRFIPRYSKNVFVSINTDHSYIWVYFFVHGDKCAGAAGDIDDRARFTGVGQLDHLRFEILLPAGQPRYRVIKPVQKAVPECMFYFYLITCMFAHS